MTFKRLSRGLVVAAVALPLAQPVMANVGDALAGGVIGGIIGGVIVNQANKSRAPQGTVVRQYQSSAQADDTRAVQTSLNYFGFPAGAPDGVLGQQSRAAIGSYQSYLGYPATGDLTEFQHNVLLGAYNRAIAGGAQTAQQAATSPMGIRGLLIDTRNQMAGVAPSAPVQPTVAAQPAAPQAPAAPGLPTFAQSGVTQASLATRCSQVGLTTSSGGYTTAANMTDPNAALAQQFCLARTYALGTGEALMSKVQGFTPDQITRQCDGLAPAMKPYVDEVALTPRDGVLKDVQGFIMKSGMAPAQLETTGKICLSVGYRTDNMNVALASALLLTGLGDQPYAELVGDHLSQGFGAPARPDVALAWYQMSLDALKAGQPAVFAPGQPERAMLIRKAAYAAAGQPEPPMTQPAAMPLFAVPKAVTK